MQLEREVALSLQQVQTLGKSSLAAPVWPVQAFYGVLQAAGDSGNRPECLGDSYILRSGLLSVPIVVKRWCQWQLRPPDFYTQILIAALARSFL